MRLFVVLILPFVCHAATVFRMACGGPASVDSAGNPWQADTGFSAASSLSIPGQPVPYDHLRYVTNFTYTVPLPPGSYIVTLKFIEPAATGTGQRVFSVAANGTPAIQGLDLFANAGLLRPFDRSFPVTLTGPLLLNFTANPGSRNAIISGIQVDTPPPPPHGNSFTVTFQGQTTVNVPGSVHQLGTAALLIGCYDAGTPALQVQPNSVSKHPTTFDVGITFTTPQDGSCVILGSPGATLALGGAGATLTAAGSTVPAGSIANVSINAAGFDTIPIAALEFTIPIPPGTTSGPVAQVAGAPSTKSLTCALVGTAAYTCIYSGLDTTPIPNGTIASVQLSPPPGATFTLQSLIGATPAGNQAALAAGPPLPLTLPLSCKYVGGMVNGQCSAFPVSETVLNYRKPAAVDLNGQLIGPAASVLIAFGPACCLP
jgi:hypothetical protein